MALTQAQLLTLIATNIPDNHVGVVTPAILRSVLNSMVDSLGLTATFIREPSAAATIIILATDQEVGIDTTSSAVAANLPTSSAWATANPNGIELVIVDVTGHGDTHNITPVVSGSDIFIGGLTPLVTSPYGLIKLRPVPGTGWYLRQ